MKYYDIVILVLCLHVSIAMVNTTGVFSTHLQNDNEWFNRLFVSVGDDYSQSQVQTESTSWGIADFVKGLAIFIWNFAVGVIVVPATLGLFGLTSPFVYYISVLIYAVYITALAQMIADRQFKGMA